MTEWSAYKLYDTKAADAVLDYTVDWSLWLPDGDSIISVDFAVAPIAAPLVRGRVVGSLDVTPSTNDCTIAPAMPSIAGGRATCWVSNGVPGRCYAVTFTITTAQSRIDSKMGLLPIGF